MLTKTIISDLITKIETAAGAEAARDFADTTVYHPTRYMDSAPELRSQGREIEDAGNGLFVIRDLAEDGMAFDLWFALHACGASVVIPVIK